MFCDLRRVAATMAAPVFGRCGQNVDIALLLADGSHKGMADSAYDARLLSVGEWVMAVWEKRLPEKH